VNISTISMYFEEILNCKSDLDLFQPIMFSLALACKFWVAVYISSLSRTFWTKLQFKSCLPDDIPQGHAHRIIFTLHSL
jgi:hypothetical protein